MDIEDVKNLEHKGPYWVFIRCFKIGNDKNEK